MWEMGFYIRDATGNLTINPAVSDKEEEEIHGGKPNRHPHFCNVY